MHKSLDNFFEKSDLVATRRTPYIFECRIYTPDGELKEVVSANEVMENSRMVSRMVEATSSPISINSTTQVRKLRTISRVCSFCNSPFDTFNRKQIHCDATCGRESNRIKNNARNKKNKAMARAKKARENERT